MSIAYTREGSGAPLLLVHGIAMSGAAWVEVSAALRDRFDVVSVDLPGFGRSDPLDAAPTVPALAAACASLMRDELGFDEWAIAGNSLGGGIAIDLALRGAVTGAVAFSPVGFVGQGWERVLLHGTIASVGVLAPVLGAVVPPLPGPARRAANLTFSWRADRIGSSRLRAAFADISGATRLQETRRTAFRWSPSAGRSPVPLTIAWGERDYLLVAGPQSARARAKFPDATHVPLPDIGHLPGWDAPETTARVIADSLG